MRVLELTQSKIESLTLGYAQSFSNQNMLFSVLCANKTLTDLEIEGALLDMEDVLRILKKKPKGFVLKLQDTYFK